MSFDAALKLTLYLEGGEVNDPDDPGGHTNYGVTQAVYDEFRDDEDKQPQSVKLIAMAEVRAIYDRRYWRLCGAPALMAAERPKLATVAFDWAVNAGVARARWYVQAAVGAKPDGDWGTQTLNAIALSVDNEACAEFLRLRAMHYRARSGELGALDALRASGLAKVAPKPNATQRKFLKGWLRRLRVVARDVGSPVQPIFAAGSELVPFIP